MSNNDNKEAPDAPQFIIRGTVKDANQVPAPGMLVRALDRDLRKEELLGTTQTDASGQYQIPYKSKEFGHAESATADIIVRVFTGEKATKPSAESPLLMNVDEDITIDLVLSGPGLPEWNRITNAVTPLLDGQGDGEPLLPAQLNDADLTFIAGETGLGLDLLQLWVLAAQQANQQPSTMSTHLLRATGPDARPTAAADTLRTAGPNVPHAATPDAPSAAAAPDTLGWQLLYGWFRDACIRPSTSRSESQRVRFQSSASSRNRSTRF